MNIYKQTINPLILFERYIKLLVILWTILIAVSLIWGISRLKNETLELAGVHADITLHKDLLYRRWNTMHGGVYVPITKETQPNLYLSDVPDRDITTLSGKRLTLVNPAYMTRQVHDLMESEDKFRGQITSLNPLNPHNAPDPWEVEALRTFEQGKTKVNSISRIKGKEYFRSMTAFVTEKHCLKCHAKQGYREGDIRGGISVSIPMAPFRIIEKRQIITFSLVHVFLWAAGLIGMGLGRQKMVLSEKDRIQATEALQREKNKAQKYLDIAAIVLIAIDSKQNVVLINKRGREILGYDEEEIVGKNWFDNFVPDSERERVKKGFVQLISGKIDLMEYFENTVSTKSGALRLIGWNNTVLRDEKGTIIGTLSSGEDITDLRQSEEKLKKLTEELKRSNADLQQFAYAASHDLQAPIRNVEGFAKLLSKRCSGKLDGRAEELIAFIIEGVKNMQTLITDLLEYSQVEARVKEFKAVDSSNPLALAIANLQKDIEENKAEITYDNMPVVLADSAQLSRLFQNLIENAIKFHGEQRPKIHITAQPVDKQWVFSISDNGIGIDSKNIERIFTIFHQLHGKSEYPGTGIGLALCRKIVERHNGSIWVESEPGKGSIFYFTMPLLKEGA